MQTNMNLLTNHIDWLLVYNRQIYLQSEISTARLQQAFWSLKLEPIKKKNPLEVAIKYNWKV